MPVKFEDKALKAYMEFGLFDKKKFQKINALIKDIQRNPYIGIGKPEALKYEYSGFWSRRIDDEHRLVYEVDGDTITIAQCKFHY